MRFAFLHTLAVLFAPTVLFAFNSAKWLEKRESMSDDAIRLQAAYSNCVDGINAPSEGLVIPLDMNPDGSISAAIKADKAQIFVDSPMIWAENLSLTRLDEQGRERMGLHAARCVIDRDERAGWIDGHAKLTQEGMAFEGDGIYFSATNNFITVYSGADMRSKNLKLGSKRFADKIGKDDDRSARIRANRADLDRDEGVVMFEGDVLVEYSTNYTMTASRLFVLSKGTNDLSRIVASGGVTLTNETRCGSSEMAVFRNAERRIELYGKDGCPATLAELGEHKGSVAGSKITYWIDTEQVEVVSPVISLEANNVR